MQDIDKIMAVFNTRVTDEVIRCLVAPYTDQDVIQALADLNPSKVPGPDCFTAAFFQKSWKVVGKSVCEAILKVLNHGASIGDWNDTLVTLILKVPNPKSVKDFCQISLCNICNKIMARAMTNILLRVLEHVIDQQ